MADKITTRATDYSQWYIDIVRNAKLADYSPVKGCMVIRPRGYAIWERIQRGLDDMFKETGHENAYFPMLIPMSFLKKEAEHVEGFAPELAVVTHGGGEELEEPLVLRPTSETIIWSAYKDWIQSYRDLPLLINQWANVIRWEKRTRLFLRTAEFLWQEGHTAHETEAEAIEETMRMLDVYRRFAETFLAIPVISGIKSESEKFAGAIRTYCIEAMTQDKKALQAGTSHFLGQNFAKAFDVRFQTREGGLDYVWATSWGASTRLIGALIMTHSDDKGLVLPPAIAPNEAVIVPIYKSDTRAEVCGYAKRIFDTLKAEGIRVRLDDDEKNSPGWKFAEYEMIGVPIRVECGPRDMAAGSAVLVRRDTGTKSVAPIAEIPARIKTALKEMQKDLFEKALKIRKENTRQFSAREDMVQFFSGEGGFAEGTWCGSAECETKLKEDTKVTIRCLPLDAQEGVDGRCVLCGAPAKHRAVFAKSY